MFQPMITIFSITKKKKKKKKKKTPFWTVIFNHFGKLWGNTNIEFFIRHLARNTYYLSEVKAKIHEYLKLSFRCSHFFFFFFFFFSFFYFFFFFFFHKIPSIGIPTNKTKKKEKLSSVRM